MINNSLENIISDLVRTLPPSKEYVEKLVLAARSRLSDAKILDIIRQDAGLTMNLLHLANSPCYRNTKVSPVESIESAIELLGVDPIVMLMASSYIKDQLKPGSISPSAWSQYEEHGREISQVCTVLANILDLPESDQKMYSVAGLTHDIGRVVIMIASEPASANLVGSTPDKMIKVINEEKAILGMNHCEVGQRIFENWHFSTIMCEGIARHHTPMLDNDMSFPGGMIFVSHFITMSDFTGDIICQLLPSELLEFLGLTRKHLDEAMRILSR